LADDLAASGFVSTAEVAAKVRQETRGRVVEPPSFS
jgi:hypothetical protein